MPVISARNLSKMYRMYAAPSAHLAEMLTLGRRSYHREFWACAIFLLTWNAARRWG
jgi:hypothetical protein